MLIDLLLTIVDLHCVLFFLKNDSDSEFALCSGRAQRPAAEARMPEQGVYPFEVSITPLTTAGGSTARIGIALALRGKVAQSGNIESAWCAIERAVRPGGLNSVSDCSKSHF